MKLLAYLILQELRYLSKIGKDKKEDPLKLRMKLTIFERVAPGEETPGGLI